MSLASTLLSRAKLRFGPVVLNRHLRTVTVEATGQRLVLTWSEHEAFDTLALANGVPVSRADLSMAALGRPQTNKCTDRSVDQLIHQLRAKLPQDDAGADLILSARSRGHWMRAGDPV